MNENVFAALSQTRKLAHDAIPALCYAPFSSLYFDRFGNAQVCCWNWKSRIGNVLHQSMDGDLRMARHITKLREALGSNNFAKGCDFCEFQIAEEVFGRSQAQTV